MDVFKHFLAGIINVATQTVYIIVRDLVAISPRLLNYVKSLERIKYEDGKQRIFFWEVKNLICSFVFFWTSAMDEAFKEGDRLAHSKMDKATLLALIDKTIMYRKRIAELFEKEFCPIKTQEEQEVYNEVSNANETYLNKLYAWRAKVETFDKQEYVDDLARKEFPKSVVLKNNGFRYAHTYLSMLLADRLPEIRGSLLENVQQLRRNVENKRVEAEEEFNTVLIRLYEKNKELLMLYRQGMHATTEAAEVCPERMTELKIEIDKLRKRAAEKRDRTPIEPLILETNYFENILREFEKISATLVKLKTEFELVERELAIHESRITTELPGSKFDCWVKMGQQYKERSGLLKEELIKAAKSLITFFCIKGTNSAVYANYAGPYHLDEYGHQVYHYEYCLKMFHLDCDGEFRETKDDNHYFYDDKGRFYLDDDGEKVYHLLECTSYYKIGEDNLMKKITQDCGHSEFPNPNCGIIAKDPNDKEMLPHTEPMDITQTMAPETTRYLWEALGGVLPAALRDVGTLRPKNPVHYLAHRLLAHKYGKTKAELREKREKAEAYRAEILKERQEKAKAKSKAWKQQFPRNKRGDIEDDSYLAHELYAATNDLIGSINFYN